MRSQPSRRAMRDLVDLQAGVVSRDIFVDDDIYQREQEQIFARVWLFVGHASEMYRHWAALMDARSWTDLWLTGNSTPC